MDLGRRVRERLAGTEPRHDRDDWLIAGLTAEESRRLGALMPVHPIPAAVLVPIVEREPGPTVLLTERATGLRNHPGQVSFPGGRIEPRDGGARAAALREAREEIGLEPARVEVVGYLPDHVVISGFLVTPVVGFVAPGFALLLQATEVAGTFEVPLAYLFEPAHHEMRRRRLGRGGEETEVELCVVHYAGHEIWGATAGMLMTLYRLCMLGPGHAAQERA